MNEFYYSDTTDLDIERCECSSIDFEYTNTRVFCVRCGLVKEKFITASNELEGISEAPESTRDN